MNTANQIFMGLLVTLPVALTIPAFAGGFIDERLDSTVISANAVVVQPVVAGVLSGKLSLPGWGDAAAQPRSGGTRLGLTVIRLLPQGSGASIAIDAPTDLIDLMVEWPKDATKLQAMQSIAKSYGVDIEVNDDARTVKMKRAVAKTAKVAVPAQSASVASAVAAPGAVAMSGGKAQVVIEESAPVVVNFVLEPGSGVAAQLKQMAQQVGYMLTWEIADFNVDQPYPMGQDFMKALGVLVESLNADGNHTKVTVFKGNKLVRVSPL